MSEFHGEKEHRPPEFRRLGWGMAIAILAAALVVALLFVRHHHHLRAEAMRRDRQVSRGPRVFVAPVVLDKAERTLTLPADVRGFYQATIYGKVSGYLKEIRVDKGDRVKAGQLLGIIESPELNQQVRGAEADRVLKKRTLDRYRALVKQDFVSKQDYDTVAAQYDVSVATLAQLRALERYERLLAPFAGTITARYVDPGALIPAATGSTTGAQPLVDLAALERLRVLVWVQQDAASWVAEGDPVDLRIDQRPDVKIAATVSRFARGLDPRTRSMLCEIWLDNRWDLYPGTFMHATLHLRGRAGPLVPSGAVFIRDGKTTAAVVLESRVRFRPVETGIDDGKQVEIRNGLQAGEKVAVDLPAEIADGALVQPLERKPDRLR